MMILGRMNSVVNQAIVVYVVDLVFVLISKEVVIATMLKRQCSILYQVFVFFLGEEGYNKVQSNVFKIFKGLFHSCLQSFCAYVYTYEYFDDDNDDNYLEQFRCSSKAAKIKR